MLQNRKLGTAEYYNTIAQNYDKHLEIGLLEKIIRKKFQAKLLKNFKSGYNLLELNCGTGADAIFLAKNGIHVTATDISPGMIEMANYKIKNNNVSDCVETFVMDAQNILIHKNSNYDGVISNFDGLNFLHLESFSNDLASILKAHSKVIFTLLNKKCLWEFIYYNLKLRPVKAFKFLQKREKDYVNEMNLYSPREFVKFFKSFFKITNITSFGFLIPPDGLPGLQKRFAWLFNRISGLDSLLASNYPFRNYCDHYIIEMERNEKVFV